MNKFFSAALVASTVIVGPAAAQGTHSGAWHSVESKSNWSDGQLPKGFSLTITLSFSNDTLVYKSINDTDKIAVSGLDFTAALDGTVTAIPNRPRYNQVSVKRLGPDEFQVLEMKDGDVIVGSFWTFSGNGKVFIRRGVAKSADGKSRAFEEYFERK